MPSDCVWFGRQVVKFAAFVSTKTKNVLNSSSNERVIFPVGYDVHTTYYYIVYNNTTWLLVLTIDLLSWRIWPQLYLLGLGTKGSSFGIWRQSKKKLMHVARSVSQKLLKLEFPYLLIFKSWYFISKRVIYVVWCWSRQFQLYLLGPSQRFLGASRFRNGWIV